MSWLWLHAHTAGLLGSKLRSVLSTDPFHYEQQHSSNKSCNLDQEQGVGEGERGKMLKLILLLQFLRSQGE